MQRNGVLGVVLGMVLAAGMLAAPAAAQAGFTICNRTGYEASLAVGYYDKNDGWVAEGWWSIAADECSRTVDGPLGGDIVYFYGEGERGSWSAGPKQEGGYFCAGDDAFTASNIDFENDRRPSCTDGLASVQFREVRVGRARNVTLDLTD